MVQSYLDDYFKSWLKILVNINSKSFNLKVNYIITFNIRIY